MNSRTKYGLFALAAASFSVLALTGPCQAWAAAGNVDPDEWRGKHMAVFLHNGFKKITLPSAWTPLDKPIVFNCTSTRGCLLAYDQETFGSVGFMACLTVDGAAAHPPCGSVLLMHQSTRLATGTHTIQTLVEPGSAEGGTLHQWAFDYTIYTHRD